MRRVVVFVAIVALLLPVLAEAQRAGGARGGGVPAGGRGGGGRGGGGPIAGHGVEVPGWWARLDDPKLVGQGLKFAPSGDGWQLSASPAAIYWNPGTTGSGDYTVTATFTQPKAQPTDAYGLMVGGMDLTANNQRYTAFLVRPDGRFLVAVRQGAQMRNVGGDWAEHAAVRRADASGSVSNQLSVRVAGGTAVFSVNGQVVAKHPASAVSTAGNAGLRVHSRVTDLRVEGFTAE